MRTILIVEDEKDLLQLIRIFLTQHNYKVIEATNGVDALAQITTRLPDLAVVDIMMPKMDGITLTKKLHELQIPVLLLTAKRTLEDKKTGFLAGADDYVVKPFEVEELLYRIEAILRRYQKDVKPIIKVGDLIINQKSYEVTVNKETLLLPLKEFELLSVLASQPNEVFHRENLIERVWGIDFMGNDHTLNVHIKRIRQRLAKVTQLVKIITIRGVGYKLEVS